MIGRWDTRLWRNAPDRDWAVSANHSVWPPLNAPVEFKPPAWRYPDDYVGLKPGYIKQASLGWYMSHCGGTQRAIAVFLSLRVLAGLAFRRSHIDSAEERQDSHSVDLRCRRCPVFDPSSATIRYTRPFGTLRYVRRNGLSSMIFPEDLISFVMHRGHQYRIH
jgi:hypothetical protein